MRKVSRYSYRGHLQIYTRSYFENINSSVLFCHKFYILPVAHPTYRYWDLATLQPAQESRYHIFSGNCFQNTKKILVERWNPQWIYTVKFWDSKILKNSKSGFSNPRNCSSAMIQAGSSFDVFGEVVYLSTSTQLPKKKLKQFNPSKKKGLKNA